MSNQSRLYVDLHALQTVPPSCVNRDDTGSPKTAVYGGTTRARISSQAWKYAMRGDFHDAFADGEIGIRTKKVIDLIAEAIRARDPALNAAKLAEDVLTAAGVKSKEPKPGKDKETGALFFISRGQIEAMARLAVEKKGKDFDKKACQAALMTEPSIDIALFGRMVADDPSLNFDAAAQVAHAISTHTVRNEYDYFTAMDDCSPEDNAGAGHLGTVEYNSATMYRYATVNVLELVKTLKGDAPRAVRGFADAFIRSMPTGRQNTFANRTLPDAVYVAVRTDQPVNMAGAFEKPVFSGEQGYVEGSARALIRYAEETYRSFVPAPALALGIGEPLAPLTKVMPLPAFLDALEAWIAERLAADGRI